MKIHDDVPGNGVDMARQISDTGKMIATRPFGPKALDLAEQNLRIHTSLRPAGKFGS